VLPKGIEIERVFSEVLLAIHQNPKLAGMRTPASLVTAVARAVGWGLTIGEKAHLVPFNVKVKRNSEWIWESRCPVRPWLQGDRGARDQRRRREVHRRFNFYENERDPKLFEHGRARARS
jgi:hypothetical protein